MTINVFDQDTGMFVSQEHQDIATIIQDYNPELHLVWIKPQDRVSATDREYPFAIMHFPRDGEPYIVMMIKENELDQRVLARLFEADQAKGDPMAKLKDRKSTRLNSSHVKISYAVFCLKKKSIK